MNILQSQNTPDTASKISVLTNHRWMGKRFFIDYSGALQKQANGLFTKGRVSVHNANSAVQLAKLTETLTPNDALCLGVPKDGGINLPVVTRSLKQRLTTGSLPHLSRTKDDFVFPNGEGWLLIDHDTKDLPDKVKARLADLGGIFEALQFIWPELIDGDFLVRPSSSAGVHIAGHPPNDATGFHMFVRLERAQDIPLSLQALHAKCWENDLAYHMVSKSGQLLDRSIIDVSVGSPERLIFTAPPILASNVLRQGSPTSYQSGRSLEAPNRPCGLAWSRHRDINRQQTQPHANARRDAFLKALIDKRVQSHGGTYEAAKALTFSRVIGRSLFDEDVLILATGRSVLVGELLGSLKKDEVIPCADPIEGPDYNPTAAAVIWKSKHKVPALISHAHGLQTRYTFARFERQYKARQEKQV